MSTSTQAMPTSTQAWGGLMSAGVSLATALLSNPYHEVKEYNYSVSKPQDNSAAVYNRAYSQAVTKQNALELMHKGELSITAARLRGVKERTAFGLSQDEAEAQIRSNAAVAGVQGGSVDDSIYQTYANMAFRLSDQAVDENNNIELALADVYKGNQASATPMDDYGVATNFTGVDTVSTTGSNFSWAGAIMNSLGTIDHDFFSDLGLALEDSTNKQDFTVGNDWHNDKYRDMT